MYAEGLFIHFIEMYIKISPILPGDAWNALKFSSIIKFSPGKDCWKRQINLFIFSNDNYFSDFWSHIYMKNIELEKSTNI